MYQKGEIADIFETKHVKDNFKTKKFVLLVTDKQNPKYDQYILFELINKSVDVIEGFQVGDKVSVKFQLRGRRMQGEGDQFKYFNSIEATNIEKMY